MLNFYNLNIIPNLLKNFKVKKAILSGLNDSKLINEILKYEATFIGINTDIIHENFDNVQGNPLNALRLQNNYEAIFINDDPNWYTTYTELNIIKETNEEFPLVFICNNKFPHKYRDSYSNPENIPIEYINEYKKELPITYDKKEIIVNDGYYHSCNENTPKNGVSVAIEDFLKENEYIAMMDMNFSEEITILYPKSSINKIRIDNTKRSTESKKIDFEKLSNNLNENKILFDYIDKYNITSEINGVDTKEDIITDYQDKLQIQNSKIQFKDSQLAGARSELDVKDLQIKNIESKLVNKEHENKTLETKIKNTHEELTFLKQELEEEKSKSKSIEADYNFKIKNAHETIDYLKNKITEKDFDLEKKEIEHENQIKNKNNKINSLNSEIKTNKELLNSMKNQNIYQENKLNSKDYCISCYKEEINDKKLEIEYLNKKTFLKKIISPFSYLFLLLKSKPKELSINLKLLKALNNSKCFDIGHYLNNNKDLQKSKWIKYFSPELHYICKGFDENREFNKKYYNTNSKEELLDYLKLCEHEK